MSETIQNKPEVKRISRMLRETAKVAREASMTGALQGAGPTAAAQYNRFVSYLEQAGSVPTGFFQPLAEGASFDEVGFAARQLAGYLEDDDESDEEDERSFRRRKRREEREFRFEFAPHEMKDLANLGQTIRESMPEWLRGSGVPPGVPTPPTPPTPPTSPGPGGPGQQDQARRMAETASRLNAIASELQRTDISDERRAELAQQLAKLAAEQGSPGF
jgi:hypothetical protein